jgi:hypothetical protein
MTDAAAREPDEKTKACRYCGEHIPVLASLCRECKCYQDWRGVLGISQTTLALLVALVSVVATTGPFFIDLFTPKNSKLFVNFQGAVEGDLLFSSANLGTRPAIIGAASIDVIWTSAKQGFSFPYSIPLAPKDSKERTVAAGSSSTLALAPLRKVDDVLKEIEANSNLWFDQCIVYLEWFEFSGEKNRTSKSSSCASLFQDLYGIPDEAKHRLDSLRYRNLDAIDDKTLKQIMTGINGK